ncbi:hypothetical protein COEREDRAFT_89453 [Coemansia reversa NRRL 1564]|uniref:Uncharacterized protein n=1 Tax=Coemansia reversa (strain ATCC 12441 / NRRL 1564) TaxID=763665 RepID=A0A2G5B3J5_COERN|nr:hypothetical protein COEREDRAFT_89453 [Coemansia reversa NRRL 1564]|eukprot:PIA13589.1 hypothetical protein COEREDRAFT_89453 [Coemansia reversa NRRL 1564]
MFESSKGFYFGLKQEGSTENLFIETRSPNKEDPKTAVDRIQTALSNLGHSFVKEPSDNHKSNKKYITTFKLDTVSDKLAHDIAREISRESGIESQIFREIPNTD